MKVRTEMRWTRLAQMRSFAKPEAGLCGGLFAGQGGREPVSIWSQCRSWSGVDLGS